MKKNVVIVLVMLAAFVLRLLTALEPNAEPLVAVFSGVLAAVLAGVLVQLVFFICTRWRK